MGGMKSLYVDLHLCGIKKKKPTKEIQICIIQEDRMPVITGL